MIILVSSVMGACSEDLVDSAILSSGVDANSLLPLSASDYTLKEDDAGGTMDTLRWAAPDYGFQASVNYTVQVDLAANNFSNPADLSSTYDLKAPVNVGKLNSALLALGAVGEEPVEVAFRVESIIHSNVDPVWSETITAMVSPYEVSELAPLYIIGDVQNWDLGAALQLNATDVGEYEVVGRFDNGGTWRFFEMPSWDAGQYGYGYFTAVDEKLEAVGDGDDNFVVTGTSGIYKLTVSLNTKTITMEPVDEPKLYIVGDHNDWTFEEVTWLGGGKYQGETTLSNGQAFRFFTVSGDWGSKQYNYSYFMEGMLSSNLSGTTEGDANFTFVGADGTYAIAVDLYQVSFELTAE